MKADTDALRAVLEAIPGLSGKTFVGFTTPVGTKIIAPYVLIFPAGGTNVADRLTGPTQVRNPAFTLHVVGANADSTQIVFDNIAAAFNADGFVTPPTVAGRRNSRGYFRCPLPIQVSDTADPPIAYAVVETGWMSEPE